MCSSDLLRVILAGGSVSEAARQTGMGITTVHQLAHSPAGRRYLDRERDRIDAHRTLLAATLPFMALLNPHTLNKSVDIARNIKEIGDSTAPKTRKRRTPATPARVGRPPKRGSAAWHRRRAEDAARAAEARGGAGGPGRGAGADDGPSDGRDAQGEGDDARTHAGASPDSKNF